MKMDKAKVENCIAKTRAFYDTKAVGCALLKVKNIATLPSPALSLTDYTFPDDVYKYLDARAQCTIERLAQRAELADDTVPRKGRGTALPNTRPFWAAGWTTRAIRAGITRCWMRPENWKSWQWMKTTRYSGW